MKAGIQRCGRVFGTAAGVLAALLAAGCSRPAPEASRVALSWSIDPSPPRVGLATVRFALQDTVAGEPVRGAQVQVEGNMSHPGMAPSLADAREVRPGTYEARLRFTMAGDWYLLLDIALRDGGKVRRQVDVPKVRTS